MIVSKWLIDFKASQELAIALIWVSLPDLPMHFLNMKYIHRLRSMLECPLHVDMATKDCCRTLVARVLIELDASKPPVRRLWIGDGNQGF